MSHHDHEHAHHADDDTHTHTHTHTHEKTPLSLKEQLETLLSHWVGHNDAHK